ncbi:MAG: hypothetical protein DME97_05365 [Verrucomicrobia bacterium]|nr:MAG: hypothetical protein DME97_05365 [Verrucomicrobiota bacterium]
MPPRERGGEMAAMACGSQGRGELMETKLRAQSTAPPASSFTPGYGGVLQRSTSKNSSRKTQDNGAVPPVVHEALHAPGQSLDAGVRAFMEPRFGHDFSRVRVHTDGRAADSARELNALAYTVGRDVVFGTRQYAPTTREGRQLLAHELAHVVQQNRLAQRGEAASFMPLAVGQTDSQPEREAEGAADALFAGGPISLSPGAVQPAIYRQGKPPRKMIRANRFLPGEKTQLRTLGRGELDELIDQIIADGAFHKIREETIDGVLHIWEVKTAIVELSEQEQSQGASYGGAVTPEKNVPDAGGKTIRHQETYILRGGQASTIESALHELIHLRIMIDRRLPVAKRSSFYNEYAKLNEMTEVMSTAKFGKNATIGQKASYGALPIVSGLWEQEKVVLQKIAALRSLFIGQDADAEAKYDKEPSLSPAALIEFLVQEKYVKQAAGKAVFGNSASNETVARLYGKTIVGQFEAGLSEAAQTRFTTSSAGSKLKSDAVAELLLSIRVLFDAVDKSLREAKEFEKNPPKPPDKMPDPIVFEKRPVGIGGEPILF